MKKELVTIFLFMFLANIFLHAQQKPFEGVINYTIETINTEDSTNNIFDYIYFININKFRIEDLGLKYFTIIDENRAVNFMPTSKIYMEVTNEELANNEIHQSIKKENELLYKFTDEKKEILGYTCNKISYKYKNAYSGGYNEVEIWGIKDRNVKMPCSNFDIHTELLDECFEFKIIPLHVIVKFDGGKEKHTYKATRLIEKKLPKNIFIMPKDYKKYETPIPDDNDYGDEDDY
ncbi:MAG: hypothetical protein V1773_07195 [bacterium]